jgi:hypothetical protein
MKLILTDYEKNHLLNRLPKVELSYDTIIHKKVFDKIDYYLAIPKGNRCLLWFTYYKSGFVAVVINLNKYNKFEDVNIYTACFDKDLAIKDTLVCGYEFRIAGNDSVFFACTNILLYKGESMKNDTYSQKFVLFNGLFQNEIKQVNYCKDSLLIGLPVICDSYKEMHNLSERAIYETNGIMYLQANKSHSYGISYQVKRSQDAIFKVKASIQDDIYYLYYKEQDTREDTNTGLSTEYDIALIDSYKTSVMMNKIFRNIKENRNLDFLEESDDEDDFENTAFDKYVSTNVIVNIKCVFNNKFKKWQPIGKTNEPATSRRDLMNLTNTNTNSSNYNTNSNYSKNSSNYANKPRTYNQRTYNQRTYNQAP